MYLLVNVSEVCDYATSDFYNRVLSFPVRHMGVPKLADLWDLFDVIRTFIERNENNVCAVHTKLGSGRVGFTLAAWLLYTTNQSLHMMPSIELRLHGQSRLNPVSLVWIANRKSVFLTTSIYA